ncbi:DUF2800 domain-containing protein [Succiniclasticum ruminis]|uniref:DUF2800 domain-containing protein n=1 Tax=Succiniclasticum ruminis DSM 9236 TaxID=1123323 RepID=A0A1I2BY84_9FIRM|nr:DUF2800 domain-containing protein [Succiniclasticum ruminis]SFE61091.1 Protein of unknown function [Succiniclasticum ruminis DSM 9236]
MSRHALLTASGSKRWLSCPPSARLEATFADKETTAAAEGTAAHALAEYKIKRALRYFCKRPVSEFEDEVMNQATDDYAAFILEQMSEMRKAGAEPTVMVETRLDFSNWVPDGFGTGDCIIIGGDTLHIMDLKYGAGVLVEAEGNSQMRLYALGAIQQFGCLYDVKTVHMTIFQPRRDNVSTATMTVEELMAWAETELRPKAELAFAGEGKYHPGSWCLFCKAADRCRARAEENLKLAREEFGLPPLLTDEEIETLLPRLSDLVKWANDLQAYALDAAVNHGKHWDGFKLVEGRSIRRYADEEAVAKAAEENGYRDIYRKALINLGEMERLMGKKKFSEILGAYIVKPPGKPTLVPVGDKRPAITVNNVKADFKEEK